MIEIENLSHLFSDGTLGLDRINLTIRAGEFVLLAGRNGSGKTSLLLHLNGLLTPTQGSVRIGGVLVSQDLRRARRMVGMVFQNPDSQIIGETVSDDIAFGPENLCLPRPEIENRVAAALRALDLEKLAAQRPHLLSGGEKRRLAIAGILAMQPSVIVLDEPFTSLDYPAVCEVLRAIVDLQRAGHTILLVTHDLEKVAAHAGRLIIMADGRIAADDPPQALMTGLEAYGVRTPCAVRWGREIPSWLN